MGQASFVRKRSQRALSNSQALAHSCRKSDRSSSAVRQHSFLLEGSMHSGISLRWFTTLSKSSSESRNIAVTL